MRSKCNVDGALVATICNHVGQQVTRTLQREFTRQASCNRRCRHACFPSRLRSSETVFRFWFSEAVCRGRRNHCCANGDATCGRLQNHHRCIKNEISRDGNKKDGALERMRGMSRVPVRVWMRWRGGQLRCLLATKGAAPAVVAVPTALKAEALPILRRRHHRNS